MAGMNVNTGYALSGIAHIQQSIADILNTPIGSRVMRREYGSLLPELIDRPINDALILQVYSATVMAIAQWEPRVALEKINWLLSTEASGAMVLMLDIIRWDTGTPERAGINVEIQAIRK